MTFFILISNLFSQDCSVFDLISEPLHFATFQNGEVKAHGSRKLFRYRSWMLWFEHVDVWGKSYW